MAATVYAPRSRGEKPKIHDFTMIFLRDDTEEPHEFSSRPRMAWQDLSKLVPLMGGGDTLTMVAIDTIDRVIRRCLRDDDGIPAKWEAVIVDGGEDGGKTFVDPQGDRCPVDLLPAYTVLSAGSSRRRWMNLMDEDNELTIEPEQILELANDLLSVASERPIKRSEPLRA